MSLVNVKAMEFVRASKPEFMADRAIVDMTKDSVPHQSNEAGHWEEASPLRAES